MEQPETPQPNHDPGNSPSWLNRLIHRFSQRAQGDVIAAQVGESARNVVVGKNVIQIGTLQIPFYLAAIIVVGIVLITVSTAVIAFSSSGAATLWGQPARMTGLFNIAVANFGELGANGQIHTSADGSRLSQWVYEALQTEYTKNSDVTKLVNIEIWHGIPGLFGRTTEFSALQDETAARQLAEKVNAHIVIYGNVDAKSNPTGIELKFYIAPQSLNSQASSVIGPYTMGQPIPVKLPFNPNDPVANVVTIDSLHTRSAALSLLTIGLTYELAGKDQKALDLFQQAAATLADLEPGNGQEIVEFFKGREALFLKKDGDAETAFRAALTASNQRFARAQIGLGSVYLFRAQNAQADPAKAATDLAQALTNYQQGIDLAKQAQEPLVEKIAQLALASALRVQGQMAYQRDDYAKANQAYDQAISLLQPLLDPLAADQQYRFLAQAYQSLGAAYEQQADIDRLQNKPTEQKRQLAQAIEAYTHCVEQGKVAGFDEILRTKIIGAPENGCQARLDAMNKAHL